MSSTESTKNVKGNRKIVRAEYFPQSTIFKIPDGLDLDDKDIVERWLVKNDTLYIKYVGKEKEERIEPEHQDCIYDPDECLIEDADDHGIEYEEDEEEEVCLWACKCQNCIDDLKEEEGKEWCDVGEHHVDVEDMWSNFADCKNCVSEKEYLAATADDEEEVKVDKKKPMLSIVE